MTSRDRLRTRQASRLPLFDRAALALLFFFLLVNILGGAIRYYAVGRGLSWLPYLPHLLLAGALPPMFFFYVLSEGVSFTYLAVFVLFGMGVTYGLLNLNGADQVAFGMWVLIAFLFGIVVLPAIVRCWRKLGPYALGLWALAVAGVLINVFHQWPWVGFEYQVGTTSVQASRLWQVAGWSFARLPGFSRASFSAAAQILFLALFLRLVLQKRRWWVPMWLLYGIAIAFTTSKAPIGIYVIFSVMWLFYHGAIRRSWKILPACVALIDILVPFSMMYITPDWLSSVRRSPVGLVLVGSFVERLQVEWPKWITMTVTHGSAVLGRGLGGVGSATAYFEPALVNAADNIAVYLYGVFGVLGLLLLLAYSWRMTRVQTESTVSAFLFFCACAVLLKGFTAGVMEDPITAMAFGMSLRYALDSPAPGWRPATVLRSEKVATGPTGGFRPAEM